MLWGRVAAQGYNQNPSDFLAEAEQMPDNSYSDIMNMVGRVGSMENTMGSPPPGNPGLRSGGSLQEKLEGANDPVAFMDALRSPKTRRRAHAHYPTTRLAQAVHMIHRKMEQRKAALRRKRFGAPHRRRRLAKDTVTREMLNDLMGKSAPRRKLGMGGAHQPMGLDPGALQDLSTVMSGGKLLHSDPMPMENTSDVYGTMSQDASLMGQKGLKELSAKMVDQFMPKIQRDVDKEMKKRFGGHYLVGHHRQRHHHYRQHHHHRPFHRKAHHHHHRRHHHFRPSKKHVVKSLKIMKQYLANKNHHLYDRHLLQMADYDANDAPRESIANGKIIV